MFQSFESFLDQSDNNFYPSPGLNYQSLIHTAKVIIHKSRSDQFLWNRNWAGFEPEL